MQAVPSSYRDTDGFVFEQHGKYYRYIQPQYESQYRQLMDSGLYENLASAGLLIGHEEMPNIADFGFNNGRVLMPQQLSFISYPYEWSFDMWKDAALLTLEITRLSLQKNMMLKDATPFNVQFEKGIPVFIDTLSFTPYIEGKPWAAYRQFCESFLGPLLLMKYCHPDTGRLLTVYPNGIPLEILVQLLPAKAKWNAGNYMHIYLQEKITRGNSKSDSGKTSFSRQKFSLILEGLTSFVKKLNLKERKTVWDDYYSNTILGQTYLNEKTEVVRSFVKDIPFTSMIDLGANDGHFSFLFPGKRVVALDADANCINAMYLINKTRKADLLPLLVNLVAPSPAIGWANEERSALSQRLKADLVMALALVHHLAIGANLPLPMIASWLQPMGEYLLIEFVPKSDEKVQLLLQNREDIFINYSLDDFKAAFGHYYEICRQEEIGNTKRELFMLKRK